MAALRGEPPAGPEIHAWRNRIRRPRRLGLRCLADAPDPPPVRRRADHGIERRWRSRPISRVLSWTVIPLGAPSPVRSSNLPGPDAGNVMRSLFGLAPGGVCRAGLLPGSRCALTAPFHPCRPAEAVLGGIFLLHFPSARAAQALPGTVPCGARTFLGTAGCRSNRDDATVWPTPPRALSHAAARAMPLRAASRAAGHPSATLSLTRPARRTPASHQ
jgi:hypothetical protein